MNEQQSKQNQQLPDPWAIVIAPGPSMTCADVAALRGVGYTIAVNCAVMYVPWADALFAADGRWYQNYGPQFTWYKGIRISKTHRSPGVQRWTGKGWARTGGNSGHMAIQWAVDQGYRNIALLGFDQQVLDKNKAHCHGNHPETKDGKRTNMSNCTGVKTWPRLMNETAKDLIRRNVEVVNLSRETALECFERMTVEEFMEKI